MIKYLWIIFISISAQAIECGEEINFFHDEEKGGPEALSIQNQKNTGICYAISAATAMDFLRKKKDLAEFTRNGPVDPIWVAFNYHRSNTKDKIKKFDGGLMEESTWRLSGQKTCNNAEFSRIVTSFQHKQDTFSSVGKNSNFLFEFYLLTVKMMKKIGREEIKRLNSLEGEPIKMQQELRNIIKNLSFKKFLSSCTLTSSRKDFVLDDFNLVKIYKKMLPYLEKKDYLNFFGNAVNCDSIDISNSIPLETLTDEIKIDNKSRDPNYIPQIIQKLSRELEKFNPLGISYDSDIYEYTLFGKTLPVSRSEKKVQKTRHASVLVGKRTLKGECQFLLKNSWGENLCGTGWICHKDGQKRARAEWINAKELLKWTFGITIFSVPIKKDPISFDEAAKVMESLERYNVDSIFKKTKVTPHPDPVTEDFFNIPEE
jgi:hypothetical protein